MNQRYEHQAIINCTQTDIIHHQINGWEICGVNGNTNYPHPTIYFKRPWYDTNKESNTSSQ